MPPAHDSILIKLAMVGNAAVGKSSLVHRLINGVMPQATDPTLGVDIKSHKMSIGSQLITLNITDTAGQELFSSITSTYYRGRDGIVLVYSWTDDASYNETSRWLSDIIKLCPDDCQILLVANKSDLKDHYQITQEQYTSLLTKLNDDIKATSKTITLETFSVSAKSGDNVKEAFENVVSRIVTLKKQSMNKNRGHEPLNLSQPVGGSFYNPSDVNNNTTTSNGCC